MGNAGAPSPSEESYDRMTL